MKTCTFFGHRQVWENLDEPITELLTDLIENQSVTNFYVGNQGDSDIVVTYITYPIGGSAKAKEYAEKRNKPIINIVDKKDRIQ